MIYAEEIYKYLKKNNINFFTGVPDSVLKNILLLFKKKENFIAANEGSAVAQAIGYYLAKKKLPLIYLQNSGLGNAINPLISIAHSKVYSIPMMLMIGWRGAPNTKDEPQHMVKGAITLSILKLLNIKYKIINNNDDLIYIKKLKQYSLKNNKIVAILFKNKKIIKKFKIKKKENNKSNLLRSDVIFSILKNCKKNTRLISTTGYTSRELSQIRNDNNFKNGKDFYMVGGMGHASTLGSFYNEFSKNKTLILDGDGSLIMHLGGLSINLKHLKKNFIYILFNNEVHESVGGQNSNIDKINLKLFTKSIGFEKFYTVSNIKNFNSIFNLEKLFKKKVFINLKIKDQAINNLGRPKNFIDIKKNFIG